GGHARDRAKRGVERFGKAVGWGSVGEREGARGGIADVKGAQVKIGEGIRSGVVVRRAGDGERLFADVVKVVRDVEGLSAKHAGRRTGESDGEGGGGAANGHRAHVGGSGAAAGEARVGDVAAIHSGL